MAISPTVLTTGSQAYDGVTTSFTTASISPAANRLLLLCVSTVVANSVSSITGNGLTWDLVDDISVSASRMVIYRAMGSSTPSSGGITFTSSSANGYEWAVVSFAGLATGANGANAILQHVTGNGGSSSVSITLSAFSASANATFLAASHFSGSTVSGTAGSGFTEIVDITANHPSAGVNGHGLYVEWQNANDTTADFTSTGFVWSGIALELRSGNLEVTLTNSRSTSASIARTKTSPRSISNSRSGSRAVARIGTFKRTGSRTGSVTVTLARIKNAIRTRSNSRSMSAATTRLMNSKRFPTNSRSGTNALVLSFSRIRALTNSRSMSAALTRPFSVYHKTVSNSRTGTRAVTGLKALLRTASNSRSGSRAVARVGTFNRSVSNSRSASAIVARIEGARRSLSNSRSSSFSLVRGIISLRTLSRTGSKVFELDWHITIRRPNLTNSRTSSAAMTRIKGSRRSLSRSGSTTNAVQRVVNYRRALESILDIPLNSVRRGLSMSRRIGQWRNSNSIVHKGLFRRLTRTGTITVAQPVKAKGRYKILTRTGTISGVVARTITLQKTIYEARGFSAKLQVFYGFIQTDITPVVTAVRSKVTSIGLFFKPRDAGRID